MLLFNLILTGMMSWKLLILSCQIPVMPPLHLHCFGMCHEQLFVYCHLWGSVYSGFCIPSHNGEPSHILTMSCHMLGIFSTCVNFYSIYSLWDFPLCFTLLCRVYCSFVHAFHGIKLFIIFCGFHECFCTLLFHSFGRAHRCSMVISLVFLTVVKSLIISVSISLFMPLMNCSFSILSFFLYIHIYLP